MTSTLPLWVIVHRLLSPSPFITEVVSTGSRSPRAQAHDVKGSTEKVLASRRRVTHTRLRLRTLNRVRTRKCADAQTSRLFLDRSTDGLPDHRTQKCACRWKVGHTLTIATSALRTECHNRQVDTRFHWLQQCPAPRATGCNKARHHVPRLRQHTRSARASDHSILHYLIDLNNSLS